MNASDASSKEKLNEIFALDISRIVRLHVIYMTFKLSCERIESMQVKDQNVRRNLEAAIKVFALKQILIDHSSLYEAGYFARGSGRLVDLAYRRILQEMRP